jgi:putative NADH-flavin reductase
MPQENKNPLALAIVGAGGATGAEAIRVARAAGHHVRAIDRSTPDEVSREPGVTYAEADVLVDDLSSHFEGIDAVISCLGVGNDPDTLLNPPPLYTKGTDAICDGMEKAGVKRLIVISASFVEEKNRGPIWFKLPAMVALHLIFEQMAQMERNLRKRDSLDWTAVRPGWLMEGPPSGDYLVQADVIPANTVRTRHADLADFMVKLAANTDWRHATPAIARKEPESATSPAAVARSMTDH